MSIILNVETSTDICSVALYDDKNLIKSISEKNKNTHSKKLGLFINDIFETTNQKIENLNAIAISKGPGSYTGLRIGVSMVKGMAFALDIPLIAINTLKILAYIALKRTPKAENTLFLPMLDARRMEVYYSVFSHKLEQIQQTKAEVMNKYSLDNFLEKGNRLMLFGNGAEKLNNLFENNKNISFLKHVELDAQFMSSMALEKYKNKDFEDLNTFEPFYLKDFLVKKSLKLEKILKI